MRRRGILLTVWLAGTVLATFLAWSAVSLVGATVTETQAASTDLVVAGRPASDDDGGSTGTTTTVTPAVTGVSQGGQATWSCDGDEPTLVDASPHIGWEQDRRAPAGEVWFDHDGDDSAIVAECDDGLPVVEIHEEDYDEQNVGEGDDEGDEDDVVTTIPASTSTAPTTPVTLPGGDDSGGGDDSDGDDSSGSGSDGSGGDDDAADDAEDRAEDLQDELEDRRDDEADDRSDDD